MEVLLVGVFTFSEKSSIFRRWVGTRSYPAVLFRRAAVIRTGTRLYGTLPVGVFSIAVNFRNTIGKIPRRGLI